MILQAAFLRISQASMHPQCGQECVKDFVHKDMAHREDLFAEDPSDRKTVKQVSFIFFLPKIFAHQISY
jgi:hypothetical protein